MNTSPIDTPLGWLYNSLMNRVLAVFLPSWTVAFLVAYATMAMIGIHPISSALLLILLAPIASV